MRLASVAAKIMKSKSKRAIFACWIFAAACFTELSATAEETKLDMSAEPVWPLQIKRIDPKTQEFERIERKPSEEDGKFDYSLVLKANGSLRIIDAGSFAYKGIHYRLAGISPISAQEVCSKTDGVRWACGLKARAVLRQVIVSNRVRCMTEVPSRGETLVRCRTADGDLAAKIVRRGFARVAAYDGYLTDESDAKREGVGIWSGSGGR